MLSAAFFEGVSMPQRQRVVKMANAMMRAVRENYQGPPDKERVYEALNALAAVAAHVIHSPDSESGRRLCRSFFYEALEASFSNLDHKPDSGIILPN